MATTIISSMSVKPRVALFFIMADGISNVRAAAQPPNLARYPTVGVPIRGTPTTKHALHS
jgi:hypothetical protein